MDTVKECEKYSWLEKGMNSKGLSASLPRNTGLFYDILDRKCYLRLKAFQKAEEEGGRMRWGELNTGAGVVLPVLSCPSGREAMGALEAQFPKPTCRGGWANGGRLGYTEEGEKEGGETRTHKRRRWDWNPFEAHVGWTAVVFSHPSPVTCCVALFTSAPQGLSFSVCWLVLSVLSEIVGLAYAEHLE